MSETVKIDLQDLPLKGSDEEIISSEAEKQRRLKYTAIIISLLACALFFNFQLSNECKQFSYSCEMEKTQLQLVSWLCLVPAVAITMIWYISTGFNKETEFRIAKERFYLRKSGEANTLPVDPAINEGLTDKYLSVIDKKLSNLATTLEGHDQEVITGLKDGLVKALKETITDVAGIDKQIKSSQQLKFIEQLSFDSRNRLLQAISGMSRRGAVLLTLGVLITCLGFYLLLNYITSQEVAPKDWFEFGLHFVPRLTLIIFIEFFSYFFLRLYRTGLEEIKYFQNELTNLEAKHIALVSAIEMKDIVVITDVIGKLATTERNRILNKNQTTIELEISRIEKQSTTEITKITKQLADLVSNFSPKKS